MRPSFARSTAASVADAHTSLWSDSQRSQRYDSDSNRAFYQDLLSRLVAHTRPLVQGCGLDLGCGSGFSTEALVQAYPNVRWHGLDVSAPMLRRATQKPALVNVPMRHAAAEALPYADASFNVVVSNFSWHWFTPAAGSEVRRVLLPGGWLLVGAPLRHFSTATGNRWLARRLHAGRRGLKRLASQGLRLEDMGSLVPGDVHIHRLQSVVVEERFPSAHALVTTLESRGSLHAIFGAEGWETSGEMPEGALNFDWHVGLLHAQVEKPL